MPATVHVNESPCVQRREQFQQALRGAVRHAVGDYQVSSVNLLERFGVEVRIESSKGGSWTRQFVGLEAQPAIVRRAVETALSLLDLSQTTSR
jgi:hypothetical protein